MGKYTQMIFRTGDQEPAEEHIPAEDMALLAEGRAGPEQREKMFFHINRCAYCYEILEGTLDAEPEEKGKYLPFSPKQLYALAASLLLILSVTVAVRYYQKYFQPAQFLTATVDMTPELRELLTEDNSLEWTGQRAARLLEILREKGVQVQSVSKVLLTAPYVMRKDIFGPKEVVEIRVEGDTLRMEVKKKQK